MICLSTQKRKIKSRLFSLVLLLISATTLLFGCSADSDSKNSDNTETKARDITEPASANTSITAAVGEYITLGAYEQDNNTANGKEAIEWLVLDVQDNKALVISKCALDCRQYHTEMTDVTWENCQLRTWLNSDFLDSAFTDSEAEKILSATVTADYSEDFGTDPGNDTQDKIFLLSITEAEKYFENPAERCCTATEYAKAQGVWDGSPNGNCWWWMRSPGRYQRYATYINHNGNVSEDGDYVNYGDNAVRPAMWIEIKH